MRDPRTYAILGAAMEVHRQLGNGFLEAVYQEALALEFGTRMVPLQREVDLVIRYKSQPLACQYRADFLCYETIVVELKAVTQLTSAHHAQVINELKATGFAIGLLLNFGSRSLEHQRFIQSGKNAEPADFLSLREDDSSYADSSPTPITF